MHLLEAMLMNGGSHLQWRNYSGVSWAVRPDGTFMAVALWCLP